MSHVILIVGLVDGSASEHDGRYLVNYEPAAMDKSGRYKPGMVIETTPNIDQAKYFPDHTSAWECWNKQNGVRPDGKPNRPLTAFTIVIENV